MTLPTGPTLTLTAGTRLYHGTELDYPADELQLPAWFSRSEPVARRFARGGTVRSYLLTEDLELHLIRSAGEFGGLLSEFGLEGAGPEEIVDGLPGDFPGWAIPDNYGPGADDLLLGALARIEPEEEDRPEEEETT